MDTGKLNSGLVYTNEECIGCNHCISACPVFEANYSLRQDGRDLIYVNGDEIGRASCRERVSA